MCRYLCVCINMWYIQNENIYIQLSIFKGAPLSAVCFSNPLLSVFVTFSRLDHNELTSIPDLGQAASKIVSLYLWVLLHLLINMPPEDLYPKEMFPL